MSTGNMLWSDQYVSKIVWNITGGPTGCTFYVTIYGKQ